MVAALYDELRLSVFAYLSRLVDDPDQAEELTLETFLRAYRARGSLRLVINRRAWIYRIATNLAHNAWRRSRRFRWLPLREAEWLSTPAPSPRVEERSLIEDVLGALPVPYRVPLLLFSHYGFSVAEVAEVMGIGPGAVRTRLYRARELFRVQYERENR